MVRIPHPSQTLSWIRTETTAQLWRRATHTQINAQSEKGTCDRRMKRTRLRQSSITTLRIALQHHNNNSPLQRLANIKPHSRTIRAFKAPPPAALKHLTIASVYCFLRRATAVLGGRATKSDLSLRVRNLTGETVFGGSESKGKDTVMMIAVVPKSDSGIVWANGLLFRNLQRDSICLSLLPKPINSNTSQESANT